MFEGHYLDRCKFVKYKYHPPNDVHIRTHIYSFKCTDNNLRYIVEFDEFKGNLLLVKFFQNNHRKSKFKYNILTNSGWASRIVFTVLKLMQRVLIDGKIKNPSFAFMGSNTLYHDGVEENKANTKRFKFYKKLVATFMGPQTFSFLQNEESSIFALINKKNSTINKDLSSILKYIYNNYDILEVSLILDTIEFKQKP